MAIITLFRKGKEEQFDSAYDNNAACAKFVELFRAGKIPGDFAKSLYAAVYNRRVSERQMPWVHRLVADVDVVSVPAVTLGLIAIVEHLQKCASSRDAGGKGLLNPKVMVKVGDQKIVMKLCGKRSAHAGQVSVSSEAAFGSGDFYGFIDTTGRLEHRRRTTQSIIDILVRIAVDPATVISQLGRESGTCCYCFMPLTVVQSRIAGCGSRCGESYGVWYPNASETRQYLAEHPSVLEGATDADRWM